MFTGIRAPCCWIPRVDRGRNTGGFGPNDIHSSEQWKASKEASDMSQLCLRGAFRPDSTKKLEEGRTVLNQPLGFMTHLLPDTLF